MPRARGDVEIEVTVGALFGSMAEIANFWVAHILLRGLVLAGSE